MQKIVKRRLSESEAKLLVHEIKLTSNIIGYSIQEWLNAEYIFIAEDESGRLLGVCLNCSINENWIKIAALYVLEEFRGQGFGKALFYESFHDAINRHKNIYTITCNSIILQMMIELEFTTFSSFIDFPIFCSSKRMDFYIHSLEWLLNSYRIKEILRKQFVFRSQKSFVFGFKSCSVI
jgi:GNAT superfamily N-acetyltransferase